ncbi:hypothetical protein TSTA_002330 [Talaromyces stipitatus ATCC 10500]|uniref:LysR family regulatory protein n=1 Tax=Talaromyces stipitatus (strain ATCC 10500 / CBS 375.48 / QM 6759 / NRRL 1006) TaxID=441959 RepID=B8MT70_TALSN|nr:uncharacterized protein TSTA_002330 [Talaromyces stipitatus ATCC 10500]EED12167.1 hypothetical protein TSTA_002330 [Talaromyces stipitatus ATCC 10500]
MRPQMIPLHYFDNTHLLRRSMVMCLTLKFDDDLDADMLRDSLIRLIKNDRWRKIGGHLHRGNRPFLHVFLVSEISKGESVVEFSKVHIDMSTRGHPLASNLHQSTCYPSAQSGVEQYRYLSGPAHRPTSFGDYLNRNLPQISLHVVRFTDGTLVSLTWPHTMSDVSGWAEIFRAWSAVLAGKRRQVPNLAGFDADFLEYFGTSSGVPRLLIEPAGRQRAYIQNATFPYVAQMPPKDIAGKWFGQTATAIRKAYKILGDSEQLMTTANLLQTPNVRSRFPVLGDRAGHHIFFVNWASARLQSAIDFRAAVTHPTNTTEAKAKSGTMDHNMRNKKGVGKPSYFHSDILNKSDLHG